MKLLLKRSQSYSPAFSLIPLRIGKGVTFTLHATMQFDEEEGKLLSKYNLTKAILVSSDPFDDLKKSFRPALFLGFVAFFPAWYFMSFTTAISATVLVTVVMTIVYFKTLREHLIVSQLMVGGRRFPCESIVALIQKEAYLEFISEFLRQVLESAKTWDDREAIPIMPLDKKAAIQAVLEMMAKS